MNRYLQCSLLMLVCCGVLTLFLLPTPSISDEAAVNTNPRIKQYNVLGRTGLKVSDIGFGAGGVTDPAVIEYALDKGINFFDTAEGYGNGKSEEMLGKVTAKHRSQMIICTKLGMDGTTTKEDVLTRFEACLKRLQTSYVDILMMHTFVKEAVENPAIYEAFEHLKKEKKIFFSGISHHGPNITTDLKLVLEQNKLDVILCSYDPFDYPDMAEFIIEAKKKGIGLVAMKIFNAARKGKLEEFTSHKFPFNIAAMRWALKTSNMDTILASINLMDQVDEYVEISGAVNEMK